MTIVSRITVPAIAAGLLLSGCGGSSGTTAAQPSTAAAASAAATPSETVTTAASPSAADAGLGSAKPAGSKLIVDGHLEAASAKTTAAKAAVAKTLPERMADTGGGTQLITAVTNGTSDKARDGTLTWWRRDGKEWVKVGSAPAKFGTNGLSSERVEGDGTTPAGLFTLPLAFGIDADPGSKLPWNSVDKNSWWNSNPESKHYNTWHQNCPETECWTSSTKKKNASEHLADYTPEYEFAVFVGFNAKKEKVLPPAIKSGSGIFLHVSNGGYTAGCISVEKSAMKALIRWIDPAASPHIAIGNTTTITTF